ncbi:hypothetical protein ACHAWF_015373, partial [Thalassiosira exigua]
VVHGGGGGGRREIGSASRGGTIRGLRKEDDSSLMIGAKVTGTVLPSESVRDASDVPFEEVVKGTVKVHEAALVAQVKADGTEAGIDDFDDLATIYVIEQPVTGGGGGSSAGAKSPEGSNQSGSDGDSAGDDALKKGAIAAIVVSGLAIVALFVAYFVHVGRRSDDSSADSSEVAEESVADSEIEDGDAYNTSLSQGVMRPQPSDVDGAGDGVAGTGESQNEKLTYMYSLDDGLASPTSLNSQGITPSSQTGQMQPHFAEDSRTPEDSSEADATDVSRRIKKVIYAPPGKLGIIIDTCSDGPIVHSVKPTSPLTGMLQKGDLVVAVDEEDTREWSAHYLTKLVAKKSRQERKITVLRAATLGDALESDEADTSEGADSLSALPSRGDREGVGQISESDSGP